MHVEMKKMSKREKLIKMIKEKRVVFKNYISEYERGVAIMDKDTK